MSNKTEATFHGATEEQVHAIMEGGYLHTARPCQVTRVTGANFDQCLVHGGLWGERGCSRAALVADRVVAAGGEVAALRAEIERLTAEVAHWEHHAWEAGEGFKRAIEDTVRAGARRRASDARAEAAEAKVARVEAAIESKGKLHSTWDKRSEMVVPVDDLRAALAEPTEQAKGGDAEQDDLVICPGCRSGDCLGFGCQRMDGKSPGEPTEQPSPNVAAVCVMALDYLSAALAAEPAEVTPPAEQRDMGRGDSTAVQQRDLAEILKALGLGTHARPYSPHEVVRREVLPALALLVEQRAEGGA